MPAPYAAVVLEADGLSKAAGGDVAARAITAAAELGTPVLTSAVTLTESLRGTPRDAPVHRLLESIDVVDVTAKIARTAGGLLGSAGRDDTVDALVVSTAQTVASRYGGHVLVVTSDPRDITALAGEDPRLHVRHV